MDEKENDGCGELVMLAGLVIVVGLPVLIRCLFDFLGGKRRGDELQGQLPIPTVITQNKKGRAP